VKGGSPFLNCEAFAEKVTEIIGCKNCENMRRKDSQEKQNNGNEKSYCHNKVASTLLGKVEVGKNGE